MTELLQLGAVNGRGQEQGAERQGTVPPATYDVRQCAMHCGFWTTGYNSEDDERCTNPALPDNEFCAACVSLRLCKTSGIDFRCEGNSSGAFISIETVLPHVLDGYATTPATKRKQFCSDRCRNLYRDVMPRLLRELTLAKGGVPAGYRVICNYRDTGSSVLMNDKTGSICNTTRFTF